MGKSDYCRYEPEVRGSVRPAQIMNIASDKSGGICKQKGHGARARASSKAKHSIVVCRNNQFQMFEEPALAMHMALAARK